MGGGTISRKRYVTLERPISIDSLIRMYYISITMLVHSDSMMIDHYIVTDCHLNDCELLVIRRTKS